MPYRGFSTGSNAHVLCCEGRLHGEEKHAIATAVQASTTLLVWRLHVVYIRNHYRHADETVQADQAAASSSICDET